MVEPEKAVSRTSTASASVEDLVHVQQFGRSLSGLNAERAATSLRDDQARISEKAESTPDLLHKRSCSDSQSSTSDPVVPPLASVHHQSTTSSLPVDRKSSSASSNEVIDAGEQGESTDDLSRSTKRPRKTVAAPSSHRRPTSRPPLLPTKIKSTPELTSQKVLTLQDLGSDYTRYFSPYLNSARSSFIENPSTPLPQYPSSPRGTTPLAAVHPTNPFLTPNASTTKLTAGHDPEKNGSFIDDRLGAPYEEKGSLGWPLIGDKEEDDDEMHMPHPDDDIKYKVKWRDHFTKASIVSTIGLFLMLIGLLFIFIGLPVLTFTGILKYNSAFETPLDKMPKLYPPAETWATVNNKTYPLLQNIRRGLIDPDTPRSARTKTGEYGDEYELVFSDEFNVNNRTFYEGDDPYFFAPDIWYGATQDLEWYDPDAVTTWDGTLELRLDKFINHGLPYRSGMLNSWNQLCFKGGIFEVSLSLPGPAGTPGLWPGVWTMGNLGRPGYLSTTDGMWPYTYQACDVGITPNQSSYDGHSRLPGQRLPSCTCQGEDHPTPGTGRGAPEIDIVEAGAAYGSSKMPIATQSYQVAPFDIWYYPDYDYTSFPDYSLSYTNGYTGGPFQQAVSATTNLNRNWFDGKEYQRYSFEYVPGEGEGSYIAWKVGGQTMFTVDGRALRSNGNIQARQISEEPMSLVLNLGISNSWTWIDWDHLVFPAVMRVDYVRWYQKKGEHMVTCDPPGFETTQYIKDHLNAYTNPNFTKWDQTGHAWPKHKLNTEC